MDAEGARATHRGQRAKKLAAVVAVQYLLVAACLGVTLYLYRRDAQKQPFEDNVHIEFVAIGDIWKNSTLKFGAIHSNKMMGLVDEKKDKIYINCTGPYILYIDVCYKSLRPEESRGMLQLQVAGSAVSSFALTASHEACRGLHSVAYLRAKQEASLYFYTPDDLKVKNVTVGLNYLLGRRCEF